MGAARRSLGRPQVAHGVHDGAGRREARDDGQQDRFTDADEGYEPEGQDRSDDSPEVVHGTLEAIGAPECRHIQSLREKGVPRRLSDALRRPRASPQDDHLPGGRRESDRRREDGRRGIAADGDGPAPTRVVGECATGDLGQPGDGISDALDEPERRRGRSEHGAQEAGQQRGRDLMADVRQRAGKSDAPDPKGQPGT